MTTLNRPSAFTEFTAILLAAAVCDLPVMMSCEQHLSLTRKMVQSEKCISTQQQSKGLSHRQKLQALVDLAAAVASSHALRPNACA